MKFNLECKSCGKIWEQEVTQKTTMTWIDDAQCPVCTSTDWNIIFRAFNPYPTSKENGKDKQ